MKAVAVNAICEIAKETVPESVLKASGNKSVTFAKEYIIPNSMEPRILKEVAGEVARVAVASKGAQIELAENYMQ